MLKTFEQIADDELRITAPEQEAEQETVNGR